MADSPVSELEEWRPVPGRPTYEVSSLGRVRSLDRWKVNSLGRTRFLHGRILQSKPNARYQNVSFDRGHPVSAHSVICEIFHGPRPSKDHQVAHWNGNTRDNRANNLRWATQLENENDKLRHDTRPRGGKVGTARLSETNVLAIRAMHKSRSMTILAIANQFRVSSACIKDVLYGRSWRHLH